MKLLLDQGLPRSTVESLRKSGVQSVHAADCGLSTADDDTILAAAHSNEQIVVTLDSDFHTLLAVQGATGPSVIRIRVEGLKGPAMAALILEVVATCQETLEDGAAVSVRDGQVRIHELPLRSSTHRQP